jgi:hypothetical protein
LEFVGSEIHALTPLPSDVRHRWPKDKKPGDTPPEFIRRWYGHLFGEITRADLRRMDPSLEMALRNWLRTNEMPPDLSASLPTVSGRIQSILDSCAALGRAPGSAPAHAALIRLRAAARRRNHSNGD